MTKKASKTSKTAARKLTVGKGVKDLPARGKGPVGGSLTIPSGKFVDTTIDPSVISGKYKF